VTSGWAGRALVTGAGKLTFRTLFVVSILGGALGGLLLLNTPSNVFARLVPWLVLFATVVFTWGSFFKKGGEATVQIGSTGAAVAQFCIAIYGGYFGGGIGFLMMAALTMAGLPTRNAGATKNALGGVMNASAVLLFVTSPEVHWVPAIVLGIGAIIGGLMGAWALHRINERLLRMAVVAIGVGLTVALFLKPL
jgi:uncharacterized membrane protein YfcA